MKSFTLPTGQLVLVDDSDFEQVVEYRWHLHQTKTGAKVRRGVYDPRIQNNRSQSLGSFLLNPPAGYIVHHKDGNPLNNQRRNLVVCTRTENNRAFRRKSRGKSSEFRGVCRHQCRWMARIFIGGRGIFLGSFDIESAAAMAYDIAANKHFGEFAQLNFPTSQTTKTTK